MPISNTQSNLSVPEAIKILKEYSCIQTKTVESETEKQRLCQALLLITSLSESENLGICADNSHEGFTALSSYLKALGYELNLDLNSIITTEGAIYIKFSTQRMSHFIDSYNGQYRGVLISCQSENEAIAGTYGYFPLDLFN